MNRRGFFGTLAGAGLAVFASRTGLGETKLEARGRLEDSMEGDFDVADLRFQDSSVWYVKCNCLREKRMQSCIVSRRFEVDMYRCHVCDGYITAEQIEEEALQLHPLQLRDLYAVTPVTPSV